MDRIATGGIALDFDRHCGIISDLAIDAKTARGEQVLRPLHRAPWVASGETLPDTLAPIEGKLAGDFFCAPFAEASAEVGIHGWSANGDWVGNAPEVSEDGVTATYHLKQPIMGASLMKRITLRAGHPVVYQTHEFTSGAGRLPVAHHAMIHVPGGAQLSFSKKQFGATPARALETDPQRGRSILKYPQRFDDFSTLTRNDGSLVNNGSFYPLADSHEDLIVLTEAEGARIGWSAAVAAKDGFLFFAVKDASVLPQTVLWMSNGGRDYAPWSGRHRAVLGIEEGATGILRAAGDDAQTSPAITLGARATIAYAFGAIAVPAGWTGIADITVSAESITLTDTGGDTRRLPFLGAHFGIVG